MTDLLTDTRTDRGGVDVAAVAELIRQLLVAVGEDPDREGLKDTPARVAAWWSEILTPELGGIDTSFEHESIGDQWVAVSGIQVWSLCEHHLLPMKVSLLVGYVPVDRIIGLSKMMRIALKHAAGLQLQERLTGQIAQTLTEVTASPDVGVWDVGEHLCMSMRRVKSHRRPHQHLLPLGRLRCDPTLADRLAASVTRAVP